MQKLEDELYSRYGQYFLIHTLRSRQEIIEDLVRRVRKLEERVFA